MDTYTLIVEQFINKQWVELINFKFNSKKEAISFINNIYKNIFTNAPYIDFRNNDETTIIHIPAAIGPIKCKIV